MTHARRFLISLGAALALWLVFSWPLPRYLTGGIPMSSQNIEKGHMRRMIPGDHLQLLYHFELMRGMLAGRTPWFHNLYEFNTGDDAERYLPGAYFAPFSLLYAPLAAAGGRAFAWNAVGFMSLWLTYWLSWLLVRRFVRLEAAAALFGLVGVLLPYRWVNLLGGSPTGFAMMWVPAVWLGMDLAAREERPWGGALAGSALLLLCWCDLQSLFFCGLAMPFWLVLALVRRQAVPWRERRFYGQMLKAFWPMAAFLVLVALYRALRHSHLMGARIAGGRALDEVMKFSPRWQALFAWGGHGLESHVYVGFVIPLVLLTGGLALLMRCQWKKPDDVRRLVAFTALSSAVVAMALLALGLKGPFDGWILLAARRLIPPYAMVRQTAKIFCLMPSLLAVACAMAVAGLSSEHARKRSAVLLSVVVLSAILVEMRAQVRPTICLLNDRQAAYAAVGKDAQAADAVPRALVLPIWPGDDSSASIYEYYVGLYGIRMVNGYSPVVSSNYIQNVYEKLRCANQGWMPGEVLDDLLKRGVRYVLLHEDLFPEKVSPFPVMTTLTRLLRHPRLDFLAHAETVWAFRIRPDARAESPAWEGCGCEALFPARRWEAEACRQAECRRAQDPEASGRGYLVIDSARSWLRTRPVRIGPAPALRWMIRARGRGALTAITSEGEREIDGQRVAVAADAWSWIELPVPNLSECAPLDLTLSHAAGAVDVDLGLLAAGGWRELAPGERRVLPAPCFFHAGFTDPARNCVVFRADSDPRGGILYGPKLPLAPGRYAAELHFSSQAPAGTELGRFHLEGEPEENWTRVTAAEGRARSEWIQKTDLPANLVFSYQRNADVEIETITVERLEEVVSEE